jgi:hypothetical protein
MAFNVSDYVKAARKPFTKRITDPVVSTAARGHSSGASLIAQTTAASLLQTAGASVESIKATSNITTDNAMSSVGDTFYAIAGVNPVRATRAQLTKSRFGRMSTNEFLNASDPATRIGATVKNGAVEIISVV